MNCTLTFEQQKKFYKKIYKDISVLADSKKAFDLKAYIKDFYNLVKDKTNDPALALSYAQLIPENIMTASGVRKISDYLLDFSNLNDIAKTRRDFETDIKNVESFISPALPTQDEIKQLNEFYPSGQAEKLSEKGIESAVQLKSKSPLTTSNQEEDKFEDELTGQPLKNPRVSASFALNRYALSLLADQNLSNLNDVSILGGKGLYLVPVKNTTLDVPSDRALTFLGYATEIDNQYKLIYVDSKGQPVALEGQEIPEDAVLPYTNFKFPALNKKTGLLESNFIMSAKESIMSNSKLVKELSEDQLQQLIKEEEDALQAKYKFIRDFVNFTIKNPNVRLGLPIVGGSFGSNLTNYENPIQLSEIKNLPENFVITTIKDSDSKFNGYTYFKINEFHKPVQINSRTLNEPEAIVLGKFLTDTSVNSIKRKNIIEKILNIKTDKLSVNISNGKIVIFNENTQIYKDNASGNNLTGLLELLKNSYFNINSNFIDDVIEFPTYTGERLNYTSQSYRDFLRKYTYTSVQLRNDGSLKTFNSNLEYDFSIADKKKIYESTESVQQVRKIINDKKPADTYDPNKGISFTEVKPNIDADYIKKINDSLKRANKPTVNMSNVEIKKIKSWYNKLKVMVDGKSTNLSDILSFNEVFTLANSDVLGEFTVAGVTLYSQAGNRDYSTLYHEAWHVFSQLLLTPEQKQNLYNETRKLVPSLKEASDRDVEEYLAEDFRNYMMKEGSSIVKGKVRKNVFQKLWDVIKAFFKGFTYQQVMENPTGVDLISKLYDNLSRGELFDYKYSLSNVQFGSLNRGIEATDANYKNGLSLSDSITINKSIDYLISQGVDNFGIDVAALYTNKAAVNLLYDYAKDNLVKRLEDFKNYVEGKDPSTVTNQLHAIKILEFAIDNFGNFDDVLSGKEKNGVIAFHREKSKYLSFNSKFYEDDLDINKDDVKNADFLERTGNKFSVKEAANSQTLYMIKSLINPDGKNNLLGFPELVDFSKAFNKFSQALVGSSTFDDIVTRLAKLSESYAPATQLLTKLGVENLQEIPDITKLSVYNKWNGFLKTFDKTYIPIMEMVVDEIIKEDELGEITKEVVNKIGRATSDLTKVKNKFYNQFQANRTSAYTIRTESGNILNSKKLLADFPSINKNNVYDFVKALGIYLDNTPAIMDQLQNLVLNPYNEGGITFSYMLKAIKDISANRVIFDPIRELQKAGESSAINKLLNLQVMYGEGQFNAGVQNSEGNMEFEASERSSLSNMIDDLNKLQNLNEVLTNEDYEHLRIYHPDINPYAKYSVIINSLFDPITRNKRKNVKLDLNNLSGIRRVSNDKTLKGIKTNKLNEYDKFTFDLHTMFYRGMGELPRHASKSSSFGLFLNQIYSPLGKGKLLIPLSKVAESETSGVKESMPLLLDYLAAELGKIMIISKNKDLKNIDTFKNKGGDIAAFDLLISNSVKEQLKQFATEEAKSVDEIRKALDSPKMYNQLLNNFTNYFNGLFNEAIKEYFEVGYIAPEVRATIIKAGITNPEDISRVAMQTYLLNNFAYRFETQIFYGDISQFNESKEEFHKRNASIASTGVFPTLDKYTKDFINSSLERTYSAKFGKAKPFTNKFTVSVFEDTTLKSAYYEYYKQIFEKYLKDQNYKGDVNKEVENILKPYAEIDEGDGQGWINFDSYRKFMISIDNWSIEQQDLYDKIVNNEPIDYSTLNTSFPVIKASYYGPLATEKLYAAGLHKFSLAPLIPSVVKDTNMEEVLQRMIDEGIDYQLYKSGSKLSNFTLEDGSIPKLYSDQDNRKLYEGPLPKVDIYLKYFKNQLNINPAFKNKVTLSTQMRKLIETNLYENGKPTSKENARLVKNYEDSLQAYVDFLKAKLFKELDIKIDSKGNIKGADKAKFVKAIKNEFVRRGIPDHQMDILETNEDGSLINNFDDSINSNQIEKLLVSIIERKIIKPKVNGEQLVQVAGSGFESSNFTKPTKEQILEYGTDGLSFYYLKDGKTQPMQVKIALQGQFKKLLFLTHPDGKIIRTLERLNEAIKDEAWHDTNRQSLEMMAVRIPVQGLNSMEYMTVAEFLPEEAGSIVILPSELVAKSGGDFDIDKLSVMMPNVSISKEELNLESLKELYGEDFNNILEEGFEKISKLTNDDKKIQSFENNILKSMIDIISLESNFFDLIRPNDTALLKELAEKLSDKNRKYKTIKKTDIYQNKEKYSKMSPTRAFEPLYDLYKHSSNNIGKVTLGIGAVSNTYNIILNRVGAYLNKNYSVYNTKGRRQKRDTRLFMPHNSTKDGRISLSNIYDRNLENKVQDIISQLINGWVDIEKDAWVFDINAIYELTPTMLFLLQAGVPLETALNFISQPLVREYIKELRKEDSMFASINSTDDEFGNAAYRAKTKILNGYDINYDPFAGSKFQIYDILQDKLPKDENSKFYDPEFFAKELNELVNNKEYTNSAFSKLAFLHFLEVEEMAKSMRKITSGTNVDTSTSGDLFQAQNKISTFEELQEDDLIPTRVVDNIKENSPIAPFFIQDYILNVYKDLLPVRANEKLNRYLADYISKNRFSITANDPEGVDKFVRDFRNDFSLFIFQNNVGKVNIDELTSYGGIEISNDKKEIPVEKVSNLKKGVLFYNGKLYLDRRELGIQYSNKQWSTSEYDKLGLYRLSADTVLDPVSWFPTFRSYASFVLEREYLRSVIERKGDQSKEEYEKLLATQALENTFNLKSIFLSDNSFADKLLDVKENYPGLVEKYSLIDNLQYDAVEVKDKNKTPVVIKNIRLDGNTKDVDFVTSMNEQLEELANPVIMKVADKEENKVISKFFENLSIFAFLQSGMNPSKMSFTAIASNKKFKQLMKEPVNTYVKNMSMNVFDKFEKLFSKQRKNKTAFRFKNYIVANNDIYYKKDYVKLNEKETDRVFTEEYPADYLIYNYDKLRPTLLTNVNPDTVIVYNKAFEENSGVNNTQNKSYLGNAKFAEVAMPLTTFFIASGENVLPITEANQAETIARIDKEINDLIIAKNNGKIIAFDKTGYGKISPNPTENRALLHLSKKLFDEFNYVNPVARKSQRFMDYVYSSQPLNEVVEEDIQTEITDVELKGQEVKEGIYVNQAALTKQEQLEIFEYIKPYLEEQAAKTNKGPNASKMIGLGLRWDYIVNNPKLNPIVISDTINPLNRNKYGYYTESINQKPLASIPQRLKDLLEKATGIDMTNYDGAIINLYDEKSFISSHNDVDESKSAMQYPVIGVNLGGTGNFSIESRDGDPKQIDLKPGSVYIFGVNGVNREVFHRTFPKPQNSFLPQLTTKLDGRTYDAGSYRVTITMRRVMPLQAGMVSNPTKQTTQSTRPVEIETKDIKFTKDNVDKIVSGVKTTTLRTKAVEDGNYNIGGKIFTLTNRGLLSVQEAGGAEAITQSEAFGEAGPKFQHTKDFLAGKRKLYVIDIIPYISEEDVTPECGLGGII